jgi:hypothetical protein
VRKRAATRANDKIAGDASQGESAGDAGQLRAREKLVWRGRVGDASAGEAEGERGVRD